MGYVVRLSVVLLFLFTAVAASGQRLSDQNAFGWYASFNTIHINKKLSLWLEYQWRRDDIITDWQQSLFRSGMQYHFRNGVTAMAGYGYIVSYPYGDYPAGPQQVPEHRIFEQLMWNDAIGRVGLNHRFRLEQRFVGKVDQAASEYKVDGWNYLNRIRYQLRATVPLNNRTMGDKTFYTAVFDEIFIGFGKNVRQNIYDQNRIGLLLGYQLNKTFRAEAGYFNMILQQGGLVDNKEVFQYNHGLMANFYLTLNN